MEILRDYRLYSSTERTSVTIGNFDGIHLGHQRILEDLVKKARESNSRSMIITFSPHPLKVLQPRSAPRLITSSEEKIQLIERTGVDFLLILNFDDELSGLSGEAFVRQILAGALHVKHIFVGKNFQFGHRRSGDVPLLEKLSGELDFAVHVIPQVVIRGSRVSSTWIRELIQSGQISKANRLLGRYYGFRGHIVPGRGIGRKFLFPTLNLKPANDIIPRPGVYVSLSTIKGRQFPSVTNVGYRPTVSLSAHELTIEAHLLRTELRYTPDTMELAFLHRLRDERKFDSVEALREQIARDCQRTLRFFQLLERFRRSGIPSVQTS